MKHQRDFVAKHYAAFGLKANPGEAASVLFHFEMFREYLVTELDYSECIECDKVAASLTQALFSTPE